jgi:hypothetical protein
VKPTWNDDFLDMLRALVDAQVEFMIVGAHALAVHGIPRSTLDLDVWVEATPENARRVIEALRAFGAPLSAHDITEDDFQSPGTVYQLGLPPNRIDLLTSISGVDFQAAKEDRVEVEVDGLQIGFIGPRSQLANKRASGRDKDLLDAKLLESKLSSSDD